MIEYNEWRRNCMEEQAKKEIASAIAGFKMPFYQEIPDVGLFLEQTTKFVASYFEPLHSITITGSMISNYVKKKLIRNPVKKQYSRDQIAHIIFIAVAKTVLSLEDIQVMIRLQEQGYSYQTAYAYFCREFETILQYVFGIRASLEPIGPDETGEKLLLRNTIFSVAYKIYLDNCFAYLKNREELH